MMSPSVFLAGLMTGLGLIVAIGAQNAFVLRQGLRGEHVLAVCLTCAVSDTFLIALGVSSFGRITAWAPGLDPVMRYAGAAFLVWYGARSLRAALRSNDALVVATREGAGGVVPAVLSCLAITWLNPHVYLDTVVLLGAVSTRFEGNATSFAGGAIAGSFLFFFALGYGAAWLRPVFASPAAWRILEVLITAVMWLIAARLLQGG